MPEGYTLDTLAEHVGRELGVSGWRTVDQATIDAFADVTGDHQWIHVDVERARHESPHGATIAHGLLTLSLLPAMRAEVGVVPGGVGRVLNYGYDRIRFLAPVKAGARVRARVELLDAQPKGDGVLVTTRNTVEIEGEEKPALVADALTLLVRGP
ncbi:MAG TPA: MaoC family dehydratase [Rubricoccaceae bacterium]|nr:MaoC family dehydratase [Rubricoccaceae bacterium]